MLSNMSMRSCAYVLLFLVLVANSDQFGNLRTYTLPLVACSYALLLTLTTCMKYWEDCNIAWVSSQIDVASIHVLKCTCTIGKDVHVKIQHSYL